MPAIISKLSKRLKADDTAERCGLILKGGKVVELTNAHPQPELGYLVDPEELLPYLNDMTGTWHTHPNQSSWFSNEDYKGFLQWPQLDHYISGNDGVRRYVVTNGAVYEKG